jgi:poly-beta-1,6-N-acetyl-D-glucosamine synthase
MNTFFTIFTLVIFAICLIFPLYHMVNALLVLRKKPYYMKKQVRLEEKSLSILVPCYNEQTIMDTTILGINRVNYRNYEYILINDGSTDQTFERMAELLDLEIQKIKPHPGLEFAPVRGVYRSRKNPRIIVIDKVNGGKADALNAGIAYASSELVVTLDADSILDEQALSIINRAFTDSQLIAAGGNVHILQGRKFKNNVLKPTMVVKTIVKFQILEYLKGFFIYKASLAKSNALSIISGAFGVFKRDVLLEVGGYRKTVGEDIDITLKVQNFKNGRKCLKVAFIPEAICYTEVPETWRDLFRQRIRWQKGFIDCVVLYMKEFIPNLFKNPLSFFFILDAFFAGIVCAFLTVAGFVYTLFYHNDLSVLLLYLTVYIAVSLLYNIIAILISYFYHNSFSAKDLLHILLVLVLDIVFFRLLTLFYTLYGTIQYFQNKDEWNKVARTGRAYHLEQAG